MFGLKRNQGLDLLRIVLMFLVVIMHVLGHGGILYELRPLTMRYGLVWLVEGLGYCAVNCYALITGYVYINGKYKLSSLVYLYLQAWIYSMGIAICVWLLKVESFSVQSLLLFLFPVSQGTYWYLSSYFGLFVLIPLLNAGIHAISKENAPQYLLILFCTFTVLPTLAAKDPFAVKEGYSVFWLAFMYIIGACIRKFDLGKKLTSQRAFVGYLCSVLLAWGVKMGYDCVEWYFGKPVALEINFIAYDSPLMVIAAVALFFAFQKIETLPKQMNVIVKLSPAAFGVYLIHEHRYIRDDFMVDRFAFLLEQSTLRLLVSVAAYSVAIFTVCLLVDWIRHILFCRIGIKQQLERLEEKYLGEGLFHKVP